MINSVSGVNNNINTSPFSTFSTAKNAYYLTSLQEIDKVKDGGEEGKTRKLSKSIAIGALIAGFGTLALVRGFASKNTGKFLNKLKLRLEQKVANIKAGKTVSKFEEFYIISLRGIESFLKKSESINNITSWKDVGFQRLMWGKNGTRKITRKMHEAVTGLFEKIGRNTVISSYNTANKRFENFAFKLGNINTELLNQPGAMAKRYNVNGREYSLTELLRQASDLVTSININLENGFGKSARNSRYNEMKKSVNGLFDYFWGKNFRTLKSLGSKDVWQTFIADDYIKADKMKMANEVSKLRQTITHDILDNYKATNTALDNIDKFLDPADKSSREVIRRLRNSLNSYKKLSGNNEVQERVAINHIIMEDLQKLSENYFELSSKYKYSEDAVRQVSGYINEVRALISKNDKGALQELLTIYKAILPRNEYLKLKKEAYKSVKSLDKAIDLETVQFYDKLRDLVLGSAPTDVLSILFSIGAIGYGLTKADSRDEKISVTLKSGIPVVAAVGTSLYCSAGLVSGSKAILIGLLSGAIMNRVGIYVDDMRKNMKAKRQQNISPQNEIDIEAAKIQPKTV